VASGAAAKVRHERHARHPGEPYGCTAIHGPCSLVASGAAAKVRHELSEGLPVPLEPALLASGGMDAEAPASIE